MAVCSVKSGGLGVGPCDLDPTCWHFFLLELAQELNFGTNFFLLDLKPKQKL
jgi:hypothetical protein